MTALKVFLVGVAGAAAAVPGIASIKEFPIPGGSEPLFAFALSVTSCLVVLAVFTLRGSLTPGTTSSAVAVLLAGALGSALLFAAYVTLSNKVLVEHTWRGTPQRQFVPIFLPDPVDEQVDAVGSRRSYINRFGPDSMDDVTTEAGISLTLCVLLGVYSALVAVVSLTFTSLAMREIAT